jgi:pseudouridine synthase
MVQHRNDPLKPHGEDSMPEQVRLQKYLADCGLGSRRFCENLITAGRVSVDGQTVTELGTKVDPSRRVECNGKLVSKEATITLLLNKPVKVICTSDDPQGRTTALDLLEDLPERVYTVGRLDFMSEGLILVTNDGELAHALTHPRFHIEKTYRIWIDTPLGYHQLKKMKRGIPNKGETLRVLDIHEDRSTRRGVEYTIVLGEGKNRHIRRLMEHFDKKVFRLMRTSIGPLKMDDLRPGEWRPAKPSELKLLRQAIAESKSTANDGSRPRTNR